MAVVKTTAAAVPAEMLQGAARTILQPLPSNGTVSSTVYCFFYITSHSIVVYQASHQQPPIPITNNGFSFISICMGGWIPAHLLI